MAKKSRETKIRELNNYIWTLEGKCEKVNKINAGLILQYCRFMVLAEEISVEISKNIENYDEAQINTLFVKYEKLQKLALNIYKTLKLDDIKPEDGSKENPFLKLLQEAQTDGDF